MYEEMLAEEINTRRAAGVTCGSTAMPAVGAVTMNDAMREATRCHALDQANVDSPSSVGSDGRSPSERATAAGYTGTYIGGAAGGLLDTLLMSDGVVAAADTLFGSERACVSLMNGTATDIGVGFAPTVPVAFRYYDVAMGR